MESILNTIKKMLGVETDYKEFDIDIITHINSVFLSLNQLHVGPTIVFSIIGETETWEDFLSTSVDLNAIKSYIYLQVRMLFDPPSSSFVLQSMQNQINMWEFRLNIQAEGTLYVPVDEGVV